MNLIMEQASVLKRHLKPVTFDIEDTDSAAIEQPGLAKPLAAVRKFNNTLAIKGLVLLAH